MSVTMIHKYLGELLALVAFIGLLLALVGKGPQSGAGRGAVTLGRVLVIVLSVQWLLGIVNFFSLPASVRPGWAHPILMTLLLGGVHMMMSKARKEPGLGKGGLAGLYVGTVVLIVIGMMIV